MRLHVGCEFWYDVTAPTPTVMLVEPNPNPAHSMVWEQWILEPSIESTTYLDSYGNRCRRMLLPQGPVKLRYDATWTVSGEADAVDLNATQAAVEDLPDETLIYTLASRYCPTETLSANAWRLFGNGPMGWGRVQAVCDWINANIRYGMYSTPQTTAVDIYVNGGGMCRDFAHLAITFCRALNIPARYVFGYIPDINDPGPLRPMDFHAWFEAFLDGKWWTFDARFNTPRIGRIPIGVGRDAVDVAMMTTYGPARFQSMTVWADQIIEEGGDEATTGTDSSPVPGHDGQPGSEGLAVVRGEGQNAGERGRS